MHAVSYNILACQISAKDHGGMSAVQDTDLSLLIRLVVVCDQNRKSCLGKGKFFF